MTARARTPGTGGEGRILRRMLIAGLLLAVLTAEGCAVTRGNVGETFKDEDVETIKRGTTTRDEVITRLGAPDRIIQVNGHEVFQYYRYDVKHATLLVFSRINIASDDLYIMFAQDGVVDEVVFGKRTDRLKFQFWPFGQ